MINNLFSIEQTKLILDSRISEITDTSMLLALSPHVDRIYSAEEDIRRNINTYPVYELYKYLASYKLLSRSFSVYTSF